MSKTKGNINSTIISSIVLAALTYLFFLAKSYEWFDIKWLSYDFLTAVFGGAFASSIVVLFNEIFSYHHYKRNLEDQLYSNVIFLFTNAIVAKKTLNSLLENPDKQVDGKLIENQKWSMLSLLRIICNIDYVTICKKQKLFLELQKLKSNYYEYEKLIINMTYLEVAVNKVKEYKLQNKLDETVQVNASYDLIRTIESILYDIEEIIEKFDELMQIIDYSGRYHWQENKDKINQKDKDISLDNNLLDKYLSEHKKNENDS